MLPWALREASSHRAIELDPRLALARANRGWTSCFWVASSRPEPPKPPLARFSPALQQAHPSSGSEALKLIGERLLEIADSLEMLLAGYSSLGVRAKRSPVFGLKELSSS